MIDLKLAWRAGADSARQSAAGDRVRRPHLPAGKTVYDFITLVESLGYSATLAMPGIGELPAAEFREALHQKQVSERFWDAKDYYNNFIFRPVAEPS